MRYRRRGCVVADGGWDRVGVVNAYFHLRPRGGDVAIYDPSPPSREGFTLPHPVYVLSWSWLS